MLYWLLYEQLYPLFSPLRVFRYVTFRTAFAGLTALLLCLVLGSWLIARLRQWGAVQPSRGVGPRHDLKAGTPTMGGLLIVIAVLIPTLLWANLRNPYVWIVLLGMLSFAAIGLWDDYLKIMHQHHTGLPGRWKFLLQCLVAVLLGVCLLALRAAGIYSTTINVPFLKGFTPDLLIQALMGNPFTYPFAFILFFTFLILVLVGSTNAVNLTDGLDGLAIGLMIIASSAMTVLTYTSGHAVFGTYLGLVRLPGAAELTVFCGALTGAAIGFLWYNAHPAEIFMGDVGSLALGGSMGVVAVLIKQEILLLFIGGVYVLEAVSVILQVGSFKLRGKRIFLMTPLHHHFEAMNWPESKIIVRFWITGLVMALFALTTLKLR